MSSKPITPVEPKTHTVQLSSVTLFAVFIAFSVVSGMWTNIGNLILKKYVPDPSFDNISQVITSAVVVTALFAVTISYTGLSFTNFTESNP